MKNYLLLFFLLVTLSAQSKAYHYIPADNPYIHYMGRVSFKNPKSPCMTFPGTGMQVEFTGTCLKMKAKPKSGYFMVETDGSTPHKIFFSSQDSILTVANELKNGKHFSTIMLIYEGYTEKPEFRGFYVDQNASIRPFKSNKKLKLEFIGNSITCAYGVEAKNGKEHFSNATENFYYSFANLTALALHAKNQVVARSGIGVYRNYAGPKNGSKDNMSKWYDYTLIYDSTEMWNPKRYVPDIVCVNLGTNDLSTTPYDIQLFESAYKRFITHLRTLYPKAKIVMLTGCMLQGKALDDLQRALNNIQNEFSANGDKAIYRFDFSPADGSLGYGADSHPSKAQQQKMANELVPFLKSLIHNVSRKAS
ncbi:MAG: GDSL-type esterase/lipase family protein [Prevotella sp.]|jgi:lysophospholipase L1-like esterase|nr:SGNH/GDSL hydrolase family protein [Prevotella sp.]MCH3995394.1 GDSL-type esterase/lipase family protein [Prevotella sp.]